MKHSIIETLVGFIVLIIATAGLYVAYEKGNTANLKGSYLLKANFENVEGITVGSDVMLAGIKIGAVDSMDLDKNTFFAALSLKINDNVKLPKDSQAAVATSGFLGSKFIAITPGAEDENFNANEQIKRTQSSVNLESLIGKFMYSKDQPK